MAKLTGIEEHRPGTCVIACLQRASKLDDPTSPESHHHQPSAPNTLPQQKRVNPLQASEHPIPVRTSPGLITIAKDEEVTPPVIKVIGVVLMCDHNLKHIMCNRAKLMQ